MKEVTKHDLYGKKREEQTSNTSSKGKLKDDDEEWDNGEKKGQKPKKKKAVIIKPLGTSSPEKVEEKRPKKGEGKNKANRKIKVEVTDDSKNQKKVEEKKPKNERKAEEKKAKEKNSTNQKIKIEVTDDSNDQKKVREKKPKKEKKAEEKNSTNQNIKIEVTDDSKDQKARPLRSNTTIKSKGVKITKVVQGFMDVEVHLPSSYSFFQDCLPVKQRPQPSTCFQIPELICQEPDWDVLLLQMETCRNWEELKKLCRSDECKWDDLPPPDTFPLLRLDTDPECLLTTQIIPKDVTFETSREKPFACRTKPDGNCFFHSISRQVFGHGKNAIQLRTRCVKEAVLKENRYLSHDYLIQNHPFFHQTDTHFAASIIRQTNHYTGLTRKVVPDLNDEETIQEAYREEVMLLRMRSKWAGIWQFFQMVHVLKCPMWSHYPKVAETHALLRHDYNRLFPIDINCVQDDNVFPLHIMWTRGDDTSTDYNHFVSLVP